MAEKMQTLHCHNKNCQSGGTFTRVMKRGVKPLFCAECSALPASKIERFNPDGKAEPKKVEEPKAEEKKPAPKKAPAKRNKGEHYAYQPLLKTLRLGEHVMACGPSGSGKTHGAMAAAKALGVRSYIKSCHAMMTEESLWGYMDAHGVYHPGLMSAAWEHGGLVLLDEADASNPEVLVAINAAAAMDEGDEMTYPDGRNVPRSSEFYLMMGTNTWGTGADENYSSRQQIDAATLTRFAMLGWGYDLDLERELAGEDEVGREWVEYLHRLRKGVEKAGADMLITPRQIIRGAKMLRSGDFTRGEVENLNLWASQTEDTKRSVLAYAGL